MDPIQVAVAQLAITVGEPDANRQAAADAVAEAAAAGARLVVLPELCDSGYVFDADDRLYNSAALVDASGTRPTSVSTTGGATSPGVKTSFSLSHRCTLR